jgi:hypothetical protein
MQASSVVELPAKREAGWVVPPDEERTIARHTADLPGLRALP